MKTHKKQIIIGAVILVVLLAVMGGLYALFMPKGHSGAKHITIEVVLLDQSSQDYEISTDAAYLGQALKAQKLIEGEDGPYGMYITAVAGVTADEQLEQWWCITQNGGIVNTGADTTPIADGDHFELTLKQGYEEYAA